MCSPIGSREKSSLPQWWVQQELKGLSPSGNQCVGTTHWWAPTTKRTKFLGFSCGGAEHLFPTCFHKVENELVHGKPGNFTGFPIEQCLVVLHLVVHSWYGIWLTLHVSASFTIVDVPNACRSIISWRGHQGKQCRTSILCLTCPKMLACNNSPCSRRAPCLRVPSWHSVALVWI